MPMEKKARIADIKKKFRNKYLRQPSIDFDFCNISSSCDVVYKGCWLTQAGYWFILHVWVAKFKMPSNWKISVTLLHHHPVIIVYVGKHES